MGAPLCTRAKAKCDICPLQTECVAFNTDQVKLLPTPNQRKSLPVKTVRMLLLRNNERRFYWKNGPPRVSGEGSGVCLKCRWKKAVARAWCKDHYQLNVKGINEGSR